MARLPLPGLDQGTWGDILNDYLSQVHNTDGTLKDNVITSSALAPNAVDTTVVATASITEDKLDSTVQAKLNAGSGGTIADASSSAKGIVQLAGDLAGIASAPTVPALATKANTADVYTKAQVDTSLSAKADQSTVTTDLAGKANTIHVHAIADTTGLQIALDSRQPSGSYANAVHTHTATQVSDSTTTGRALITATDAAAARTAIGAGTSDLAIGSTSTTAKAGDYAPTWSEVTAKPATFTPTAHAHVIADVTNLQTTLDGKQPAGSYATTVHTHAITDTTGLQTAIDGKAAVSHTHTASQISDSTAVGRAVVTAADAAAAQAALGVTNNVQVVNAFVDVTTPVYGTLYVVRA